MEFGKVIGFSRNAKPRNPEKENNLKEVAMKTLAKGPLFVMPVLAAVLSAPCALVAEESDEPYYMGYERGECEGEGERFETREELFRDKDIVSYRVMNSDDEECYSTLPTVPVTEPRLPFPPPSLWTHVFQTPPAFYTTPWNTINQDWSDEEYQEVAEDVEECFKGAAKFLLRIRLAGMIDLEDHLVKILEDALKAEFTLDINQDMDPLGRYTGSSPGLIEINGPKILEKSNTYPYQPLAGYFQTHLHEVIHAARCQFGAFVEGDNCDSDPEERKVQRWAYWLFKELWHGKEPPFFYAGVGTKTPWNSSYDKDEHQISCPISEE